MEKIKCNTCGDIGYSSSPSGLTCGCGGAYSVIPQERGAMRFSSVDLVLAGINIASNSLARLDKKEIPVRCGLCTLLSCCRKFNPEFNCPR